MSLKGFSSNFDGDIVKSTEPASIDRVLHGHSPFAHFPYHATHTKPYRVPYQFPALHFDGLHDPSHDFGLKFGGDGHSGMGGGYDYQPAPAPAPVHPPQQVHPMGKKNKLKGAALSALILLAFLFFINLLQNCLKEQMNTMNPTIMVMTPFQNGAARRHSIASSKKTVEQSVEHEDDDYQNTDYDYKTLSSAEQTNTNSRISRRMNKSRREKSTIAPKLQNLFLRNSPPL